MKNLAICIMAVVMSSCAKKEQRIHVIPNGYRGWMLILENHQTGYNPVVDAEVKLYLFSGDGVCKIRSHYAEKWGKDLFLFQSGDRIESLPDYNGEGVAIRDRANGRITVGDTIIQYARFHVGTLDEHEKEKDAGESFLDRETGGDHPSVLSFDHEVMR